MYKNFINYVSVLFFLLASGPLTAQQDDIQFFNIGINDGLSNSTVYAILQDHKGFMWFGTQNGLNKYDGYNFTVFKNIPFDSTSLSNNWVQALLEDREGNIWVGTHSGGLSKYDRNKNKFINYKNDPDNPNSLINNRIWCLYEDNDGSIWIGTSAGLDILDVRTGKIKHYLNQEIISTLNNAVNDIHFDDDGYIWVCTWGLGLFQLDINGEIINNYTFENYPVKDHQIGKKFKTIYEDSDGIFWIGTNTDGLIKFNCKTSEYKYYIEEDGNPYSISFNSILSLVEDKNGNFWIGTHNGGLNKFNRKEEKFYIYKHNNDDPYSLSNNWVTSVYEDKAGNFWIGTDRGIDIFTPNKLVFKNLKRIENSPNTLSSNDVHSVYEDSEGIIWIGTWRGGLNRYHPATDKFKTFYNNPADSSSLPHNIVLEIMEDSNNNLWVGTYNGLGKFNRKTEKFELYRKNQDDEESIGYNNISAICEGSDGYLWIGTWGGGVQRMNMKTGKFQRYFYDTNQSNGLTDMIITYIFEDSRKNLYIGTAAGGLNIYKPEQDKFISIKVDLKNKNTISSNNISCIAEDKNGNLWIGTMGGGLNKYNYETNEFTHFTIEQGLPEDAVMSIEVDNEGYLWLSFVKGISCFNPANLQFTNYDYKDGLGNTEFVTASSKGRDGKILFGGKNGVTYFYPSQKIQPTITPHINIVNFSVFNQPLRFEKEVSEIDHIEIDYSDNVFSIDFVALGYNRPDKIKYAYMLEGFDNDWIHSKDRRTAYYTNLNPGTYFFKVMASTDSYNWFYADNPLTITIIPPMWQRWWFILISFAFAVLIVFLLYRYRVKQLLKMERLRVRIAQDLHDELASNLSSIAMFGKIIQDSHSESMNKSISNEMLERIINLSQHSVNSIREIIWALDPKTGTLFDLLLKVRDFTVNNARAKKINPVLAIPSKDELPANNLSPELRRNLWLLMKEIIMNSIKHSESKNLYFSATYNHKHLNLEIRDDGKGFDTTASFEGHGLLNIKRRANQLNAKVQVDSAPGEGTKYTISTEI